MKKGNFVVIILVCILIPGVLAIPQTLSLNGKLTDSSGSVLSGTYNMDFKIYNVHTGGVALYTSSKSVTTDSNGIYNVLLDDIDLTFDEQYYLGITVATDTEMIPRINLTSTPYSFRANVTDFLDERRNYEMQNLTAGNANFSGGWLSDGVSIIDGSIYAQVGYFYNITSLNVTKQNLTITDRLNIEGDVNVTGNLTLTQKITFALGEIIENIVDGWITITGGLNVIGDLNITGSLNVTGDAYVGGSLNVTGNLTLGNGAISFNDSSNRYNYYNGSTWKDMSMGNVPAGAIIAFNSATCPVGWILADGNSDTPDLRGIFVRGAGANEVLNGTIYNATAGEYQNDSFQGHAHKQYLEQRVTAGANEYRVSGSGDVPNSDFRITAITDGTHGEPRTGNETRPASYALIYCQKTTEDSETSNTIWATSGDDVVLNDASKNVKIDSNLNVTGNVTFPEDGVSNTVRVQAEYIFTADNELDYTASIADTTTVTVSELPSNTIAILAKLNIDRTSTYAPRLRTKRTSGATEIYSYRAGDIDAGADNINRGYRDNIEILTHGNSFYVLDVDTVGDFKVYGYKTKL